MVSLDLVFVECCVSGVAVGLASVIQVWSAFGARHGAARTRLRRESGRLMAAALVLTLLLGCAATLDWADSSIRGTQISTHPPLLFPLLLVLAGLAVSAVTRIRPARPPGESPSTATDPQSPDHGSASAHPGVWNRTPTAH
jgi:hypothetical protein